MAIAKLQNTITKEQMQNYINANPRLLKLQQEIQAQNAKIDAMIDRITVALDKGDEATAFNEFPGGKQMLAVLNQEQPVAPKTEARKTIASKIRPFNS